MAKKPATSLVRTVLQSVTVGRDGKSVTLPVGQPFEFTADEIEQIEKMNPTAISTQVVLDTSDAAAAAEVVKAVTGTTGDKDL
jgi:hypothetical protein